VPRAEKPSSASRRLGCHTIGRAERDLVQERVDPEALEHRQPVRLGQIRREQRSERGREGSEHRVGALESEGHDGDRVGTRRQLRELGLARRDSPSLGLRREPAHPRQATLDRVPGA